MATKNYKKCDGCKKKIKKNEAVYSVSLTNVHPGLWEYDFHPNCTPQSILDFWDSPMDITEAEQYRG